MGQAVEAAMSPNPHIVDRDASLLEAARAMRETEIGSIVVTAQDKVCGIVTDRDITVRATALGAEPINTKVKEICSQRLVTVDPGQSDEQAVDLMHEHGLRRMPVIDGSRPVGIVSLGDLAAQRDRESVLGEISSAEPNR